MFLTDGWFSLPQSFASQNTAPSSEGAEGQFGSYLTQAYNKIKKQRLSYKMASVFLFFVESVEPDGCDIEGFVEADFFALLGDTGFFIESCIAEH